MATTGTSDRPLADFVVAILQLVFHLLFLFIAVTLCGLSYVLTFWFHMPEFGLWYGLGMVAIDYARGNIWVAIGLGLFVLAALPLAWIAYREQQVQVSKTILQWIIAAGVTFGMFWLRTAWPYDRSGWQVITYGIIMFAGWAAFTEAMLDTISIVAHIRRGRPRRIKPPAQEPHGSREHRGARDEPETI